MGVIWAAILVIAAYSTCPVKSAPAIRYDQRQEGDVNVRADLENFVVLIIPTSSSSSGSSGSVGGASGTSLLDLFKAAPGKGYHSGKKHSSSESTSSSSKKVPPHLPHHIDAAQFIESKTAPYHVDISRSRSNNHHQQQQQPREVVIAESPVINLGKAHDLYQPASIVNRRSKTVSVEVPSENEADLSKNSLKAIVVSPEDGKVERFKIHMLRQEKEGKDKLEYKPHQETLTLLGSQLEQCGPGMRRDNQGVCQAIAA